MDLNSTRTAANTITDEAVKPKTYGDTLHDFFIENRSTFEPDGITPEGLARKAYEAHGASTGKDYDTWANDVGLGDFVQRTQSRLAELKAEDEWKASQPESRGFLGGSAAALGRGAMNVVGAAGQTLGLADLEPSSIDANKGYLDRVGEGMTQWAEEKKANTQFMRPTKEEEAGEVGTVKKGWEGALESLPLTGGVAASAVAGAGIGSVAGPVGTAVGATIGGLVGMAGLFGAGTYGQSYDAVYKELKEKRPEATEDEVRAIAQRGALIDAGLETGSELVSDWAAVLTLGGSKLVKQPLKQTLKEIVKPGFKTYLANTAKHMPFEVGSELATAYGQADWRAKEGLDGGDRIAAMGDAVLPAIFMSAVLGAGVAGYREVTARKTLSNLNADDPVTRIKAVEDIANRVVENTEDKELAKTWLDFAGERIRSGEKIDVDEGVAQWAATKTREDAQDEGREIVVEDEAAAIDAPEPKSEAEKILVGDADVTPEEMLLGQDEEPATTPPIPGQNEAWLNEQEAAYQREQAEASGQVEDIDAEWQRRAEEQQVAADTRMLDAEWDTRQRIVELEREIKSLSTGRGKGTKKRMAAVQEAKRELKRLRETLTPAPVAGEISASSQAVGNMPVEQVQNLHEVAPAQVDKQTAAAITKLEKRIANIEKIPEKKRSAKNQEKLDNLKMELATLTRAAQPLPMGAEYGEAGYGAGGETVAAGSIGEGVAPGVGREVGAISEPGQIGDVTGLQPGVPGAGLERATATLDEAHERAEGIREQLIADGVLTREEVEEIRAIDLDDPEYIISSRRAELVDIAHVRAAQQRAYDKTVGRILKGGGIHPEMLMRDYGADGVQWLRSRFGFSIVSDNGQPLDVWAQTLSEEAPEADIRGDADRLYSLLRDEWPSKKRIDADYREYANSLREDIKSARERSSEREAYRRGELSPEKAEQKARLEKKVANLEALGNRASKTQMRNLEAYRAELDPMDAQDGATLEAEARGVEEFGPATAGSGKENLQVDAQVGTTNPVVDQNSASLTGFDQENNQAIVGTSENQVKNIPQSVKISEPPTLPADQRTMEQAGGVASPGQRPTFDDMVKDAARWRGAARNLARELEGDKRAALRLSKTTTKGDLDAYLMRKYGIDAAEARAVSNHLTAQNIADDMTATVDEFAGEPWAKEARKVKPPVAAISTPFATAARAFGAIRMVALPTSPWSNMEEASTMDCTSDPGTPSASKTSLSRYCVEGLRSFTIGTMLPNPARPATFTGRAVDMPTFIRSAITCPTASAACFSSRRPAASLLPFSIASRSFFFVSHAFPPMTCMMASRMSMKSSANGTAAHPPMAMMMASCRAAAFLACPPSLALRVICSSVMIRYCMNVRIAPPAADRATLGRLCLT